MPPAHNWMVRDNPLNPRELEDRPQLGFLGRLGPWVEQAKRKLEARLTATIRIPVDRVSEDIHGDQR